MRRGGTARWEHRKNSTMLCVGFAKTTALRSWWRLAGRSQPRVREVSLCTHCAKT